MEGRVPHLLAPAVRPAGTCLTSTNYPVNAKEHRPGAVGAGAHPGTPGSTTHPPAGSKQTPSPKPGTGTISNRTPGPLND